MSKVQTAPLGADVQREMEAARARNRVRAVTSAEEGAALATLPSRVYGFTYSPVNENTPLYAARTMQCFEVHKLDAGLVHIVGFVSNADAEALASGREMNLNLYPEPWQEATKLVEVPLPRIVRARPLSRQDGNYMPLVLDAA